MPARDQSNWQCSCGITHFWWIAYCAHCQQHRETAREIAARQKKGKPDSP